MTWKDYQLQIQLAKNQQEFQKALAESILALLKLEEMRQQTPKKLASLKKDSKEIVWNWLSKQMKWAKKG